MLSYSRRATCVVPSRRGRGRTTGSGSGWQKYWPSGGSATLTGDVPAARVHELRQELPTLTWGEGVLECAFDRYQPVRGPVPGRARTDFNPLDRDGYLLRVGRRAIRPAGRATD